MATLVSDPLRWFAYEWENNCGYPSAVLSGIAPDAAHLARGGYHCSIEDLIRFGNGDDYSNTRPDDKGFNPRYGAAVDMSMSPADMIKCHGRVRVVWEDHSDPRRQYFNAVNCYDGSGDAVRLDFVSNTAKFASADHKWHDHDETRRRWLLTMLAMQAKLSVYKGQSKAEWLGGVVADPVASAIWTEDVVPNWPRASDYSTNKFTRTLWALSQAWHHAGNASLKIDAVQATLAQIATKLGDLSGMSDADITKLANEVVALMNLQIATVVKQAVTESLSEFQAGIILGVRDVVRQELDSTKLGRV